MKRPPTWINVAANPPPTNTVVLVRMLDGTAECDCYAVAEYDGRGHFTPVNVHSSYDGAGTPVLDFPVYAWMFIPTN